MRFATASLSSYKKKAHTFSHEKKRNKKSVKKYVGRKRQYPEIFLFIKI